MTTHHTRAPRVAGKLERITICPLSPGAVNGPPGIYLMVGGAIPIEATPNGANKARDRTRTHARTHPR